MAMACGLGLKGARAISDFRRLSGCSAASANSGTARNSSSSSGMCNKAFPQRTETTVASLDERLLEDMIYDDDREVSSGDESDDSQEVMPTEIVRTTTLNEFPDRTEFMDPKWMGTYRDCLPEFDADWGPCSDSMLSCDFEDGEAQSSDDEAAPAKRTYSGPSVRTSTRRDFPAPCEYLKAEELNTLLRGFLISGNALEQVRE
eukprot:TRINITY_DN58697_c0_g1_i1.p1 TRINITY_DN58697_c0_g1~~TRINITY_DN58697_c0_g1_i1.p1  ORF type:complete len:203 (+),score=46.92 TRINITY_DN58697_c0_g1_i1:85-693(+)